MSTQTIEDDSSKAWPRLALGDWKDTQATLHMWTQIVGKTRLALSPMQNHWWHTALYVSARGLNTSPIPYGERTFEIELDFIDHILALRTSDGARRSFALEPMCAADFYQRYLQLLRDVDIDVHIWPVPCEVEERIRFTEDKVHASYDREAAHRCWRILLQVDNVLKERRGHFLGKASPVHFWWGGFDLALTLFSGRIAPLHPGGIPNVPDYVVREGYSRECFSVGWWPGFGLVPEPAFYAYVYPEPQGFAQAILRPSAAYYHPVLHEWILPYEAVRAAANPSVMLRDFHRSAYDAAADLGAWDRATLERATLPPRAHGAGAFDRS